MNTLLEVLYNILTPEIVSALLGGLIGASITIKIDVYGYRLSILFSIGSIISAGAFSEYISIRWNINSLFAQGLIGIIVAIIANSLLDKIHVKSPKMIENLISLIEEDVYISTKEIIKIFKDGLIRKISYIFRDKSKDNRDE